MGVWALTGNVTMKLQDMLNGFLDGTTSESAGIPQGNRGPDARLPIHGDNLANCYNRISVPLDQPADLTLDQFKQSGLALRVRSGLFGEDIFLIPNAHFRKDCEPGYTAYTADELAELYNLTPSHIKWVHYLKKRFDGEILPSEGRRW